ncbi:hypothetical protein PG357_04360 [Riemerella anatipestifer]|nr:hypothetical protein [Riemerella anatipestifer]
MRKNKKSYYIKLITCILCNVILFSNLYFDYKDVLRKQEIIKKQSPVLVKILSIKYSAKSNNVCVISYNGQRYETVLPNNVEKIGYNNENFYYDKSKNILISDNIGLNSLYIGAFLCFISILLWFIPSEKFSL